MSTISRAIWRRWRSAWRRWSLWTALIALVVSMLVTMVWLAGRYEASQVQTRLERDAADAVSDVRVALNRNLQSLQALHASDPGLLAWEVEAAELLRLQRELVRLEWRDNAMRLRTHVQTPYRALMWDRGMRENSHSEANQACSTARRLSAPAYSGSYYQPHADGLGSELMELCLPLSVNGRASGFLIATYSLQSVLADMVGASLTRSQEASFTEPDGTRLAVLGASRRGTRIFTAQQLLDLPGTTLVLRLDTWHTAPSVFPNVLTALVTAMSIALVTVVGVLVRDNRRRLRAERDLGDALAFRKAMEDSLVTGLRARDLQGRITYVNPAFCEMVGFTAQELLGYSTTAPASAPYWPPERVEEYRQRQAHRFAGSVPPREGFESEFMRKDGTRFPVLIIEAPLINAQGLHTGWMSAVLDISEQRRVEELSRASQERLQATARLATVGEMASLLSHELNQPLAAISSYATGSMNLLRTHGHTPADGPDAMLQTAMQRIAEQAERAGRVIKSVHDFVRRRDQARESVSPQALLDAIEPLVRLQARKLGVQVHTRIEHGLRQVRCDRTMVEQVLLNLVRNGMQAMDHPGRHSRDLVIEIRRGPDGGRDAWVTLSVIDQGVGISEEVARQLFTPFFTTKPEGMGLGLSLCRTVVEQHGGALRYEPQLPQGTAFIFTLPTQQDKGDQ